MWTAEELKKKHYPYTYKEIVEIDLTKPNIGGLMESEEDNQLIRMY